MKQVATAAQFQELLGSRPSKDVFQNHGADALDWRARASALFKSLSPFEHYRYQVASHGLESTHPGLVAKALQEVEVLVREIIYELSTLRSDRGSSVIAAGKPYDYFEALSAVISIAQKEIFFVDPYADKSFLSTYVQHIDPSISVRLLAAKYYDALASAVALLTRQTAQTVSVRCQTSLHDRFIFIDGVRCFNSGASFKDGGTKSATVITEIVDIAPVLIAQYDDIWARASA